MTALELARALYDAYNAHAPDRAGALYAEAGTHIEVARSQQSTGPDDISRGLTRFFECFPDAHWESQEPIADAVKAAVPYRLRGTLQAPMGPLQPAGQELDLRGVMVIRTGAGAITSTEDYWDAATFREQMTTAWEGCD